MKFKLPELNIDGLIPRIPIVQGGMSVGISLSGLASAVANEGGIGVIGGAAIGMLEPDFHKNYKEANQRALRKEIRKTREKTDGIIGVNLMVALTDYEELLMTAVKEKIDALFLGAGLPLKFPAELIPDKIRKIKTKLIPIVSSGRAARIIFRHWARKYKRIPDAVVVEGPKAGGHLGFRREQIDDPEYRLEKLVPEVLESIEPFEKEFKKKVPVIAAGGIYSGKDIYKFLKLGASGVQMATRFVATHECDASIEFKMQYVRAKKEDIVIINSPVGLPGRAIRNKFLEKVSRGEKAPFTCPWKCLRTCDYRKSPYCIALALTNAKKGKFAYGFAFAGANAYLVDKIVSVKELITELIEDFRKALSTNLPLPQPG